MAYSEVLSTDNLNQGRGKINGNFRETSVIDPESGSVSFQVYQNAVGPSTNDKPIEIVNIGYTGHGATDDIHENVTGLVRINGRISLVRNMVWDQLNAKWLTPIQTATAFGSAAFEVGGEACILHATPSGVNLSDVPHEILLAKASGTDGETNNTISTGYFTQSKACIFARFNSTAYDPAATNNCWNEVDGTNPLLWLSAAQVKNTENEFARLEGNGSGVYGGLFFAQSNGTLASRTAVTTASIMGSIASKAHDGTVFQTTAIVDFVSRGTISSGNAGQEIRFRTSATNTAGLASRMAIKHNGSIDLYVPLRYDQSGITTIPDYSGNGYSPALTTGTVLQIQPASTVNGGMVLAGFSVSGTASAVALFFRGAQGHTSPTGANTIFQAVKHNGATNFADLAATEIGFHFRNNATTLIEVLGNGNTGFGVTGPTAKVQVRGANNAVSLLVEDDAGNDILSVGESGGARVIGFFGVTPAIRQVVATGSTADQIITALQNLGLFSQT